MLKTLIAVLFCGGVVLSAMAVPGGKAQKPPSLDLKAEKITVTLDPESAKELGIVAARAEDGDGLIDVDPTKLNDLRRSFLVVWRDMIGWDGFQWWRIGTLFIGLMLSFGLARLARFCVEVWMLRSLAAKTATDIDDSVCLALGKPTSWMVLTLGMLGASVPVLMVCGQTCRNIFIRLALAAAAASFAWGIYRLIEVVNKVLEKFAAGTENKIDDLVVTVVRKSLKIGVVFIAVLLIGQNILGLNITTLLAGAGVAGLAIAFAAQDTIANFFGSLMIILDRPFSVGERISVDNQSGTVEHVGLRSTRIRTLDGHVITIPNKNVANSAVENITRRPNIKLAVDLGLVYDTPADKMELALKILHEIFDAHEGLNGEMPARIHFDAFNDWSLNIKVIVWYHGEKLADGGFDTPDYWKFRDWLQASNLEILRRFNAEGLEFAFPTSTTYLANDGKRQLKIGVETKKTG